MNTNTLAIQQLNAITIACAFKVELILSLHKLRMQYVAARRGLGLANKIKDKAASKKHRSRIMGNLNRLRKQMRDLEKVIYA